MKYRVKRIARVVGLMAITMLLTSCSSEVPSSNKETTVNVETSETEPVEYISPKDIVISDIENLLNADEETVIRYFGKSDVYTPVEVSNRVAIAKVNFIENGKLVDLENTNETEEQTEAEEQVNPKESETETETETVEPTQQKVEPTSKDSESKQAETEELSPNRVEEVLVHICNIDNTEVNKAIDKLIKDLREKNPTITAEELDKKVTEEIAARAKNGAFDIHVTLPMKVVYKNYVGQLQITEEFKLALTGGWYNPTGGTIVNGDCIVQQEAQKELDKFLKEASMTESEKQAEQAKQTEATKAE